MPSLSRAQFEDYAERLKQPDGGFTVRTSDGYEPSPHGFMVAQAHHEQRHGALYVPTAQDIQDYAQRKAAQLALPGRYLGGWHDPDTHEKTLDVAQRYRSPDRATGAMWANHQDAMYDLRRRESVTNAAKLIARTPDAYDRYRRAGSARSR